MRIDQFDYYLPPELIAQTPARERTDSRLLAVDRCSGRCCIHGFPEILRYFRPGDCLVMNNTRVIPARLLGYRTEGGGRVEALLCEEFSPGRWRALLKPGRRMKAGCQVRFGNPAIATMTVGKRLPDAFFEVEFDRTDVLHLLDQCGQIPLPPYIRRPAERVDAERYQTVYGDRPGAVAAPTAGLHFTEETIARIVERGVSVGHLTLHVGPGTFKPVRAEHVEEHQMHEEQYVLSAATADTVNQTRETGGRVFAVGTTTVRVLETCADEQGRVKPGKGGTRLFLHPPRKPRAVDGLLTNFHLPRSTLLMLVATFVSTEKLLAAYQLAIRERLRFYSYGDCMLLFPGGESELDPMRKES